MTSIEILERAEDYVGIHYINGVEEPYINPCLLAAIKDGVEAIRAQQQAEKFNPPCYQPDGDGCAYQTYGDNNDEPIDRCKECPLCYSDKTRHQRSADNDPLTLEELREMDGEPAFLSLGGTYGEWVLVRILKYPKVEISFVHRNGICAPANLAFGYGGKLYRHKPEEADHGQA